MTPTSALLVVAAAAWLVTIALARDMGVMPGTMGLGLAGFVGAWTLMMAAMMLPSIAPIASVYTRVRGDHRTRRFALLSIGYLAVWALAGVAAYGLAEWGDRLAHDAPGGAQAVAVVACFACGIYQMTPIKDRCLQHCRSPMGHVMRYGSFRGRTADVRVGLDHGGWCLACCWALMGLLVVFGVMNVLAMLALAGTILVEKLGAPGRWFSVAVGLVVIGLGIAIWIDPAFAPGLHPTAP